MSIKQKATIIKVIVGCIVLLVCCPYADAEDWPMFIASGNRVSPRQGIKLVDDLEAMHKAWELDHHMGVGKGLYPGTLRKARDMGVEPFYGGTASPIIAEGTVFLTYYKPDGKVPAAAEPWRTVSEPKLLLPGWFFSVTADDILIAVDAKTGEVMWQAIEKGKGLNRLGHKRGHWSVSPAYSDGRIFSMGSAGALYAYDAKTGGKLWQTLVSPSLEDLKKEYLVKKKLCWQGKEGSSLVVADDVVVVSRHSLTGVDTKTGKIRWRLEGNIEARNGTPTLWRHGGRTYLLVNSDTGDLRLIDPQDGRVIWHTEGLGPDLGTLSSSGDLVILNRGSKDGDAKSKYGLYGAVHLSLQGAKKLWTLPDTDRYQYWWKLDNGARKAVAIQESLAYIIIRRANKDEGPRSLLVVVDISTGKILSEQDCGRATSPYLMEDRLLLYHDRSHSDPVTASLWTAEAKPRQLTRVVAFPHGTITAYEVPIQWPYVDGFLYCRALKGLVCYDLRKPGATVKAKQLYLTIPAPLTGRRSDMEVVLYERNGCLTHGGFADGGSLHAVDITKLEWDGKHLSGIMNIDVESNRRYEAYEVKAKLSGNSKFDGIVKTGVSGFKKPIEVFGAVNTMEHQPNWMPHCTHVLRLEEAVCNADRSRQYLLLFVTVAGTRLLRVEGFAPRTTKSHPVVDAENLKLKDGRLTGKVTVRYRPDPWSAPLAERGSNAAAQYNLNCRLVKKDQAGLYKGTYGVDWSRTGWLEGHLLRQ